MTERASGGQGTSDRQQTAEWSGETQTARVPNSPESNRWQGNRQTEKRGPISSKSAVKPGDSLKATRVRAVKRVPGSWRTLSGQKGVSSDQENVGRRGWWTSSGKEGVE